MADPEAEAIVRGCVGHLRHDEEGACADCIATALRAAREAGFREGLEKGTQMGVEAVDRLGKATVEYLAARPAAAHPAAPPEGAE